MKILFVEDDDTVRLMLGFELSLKGIKDVVMAVNGKEGLRMAREIKPDLIVTDIQMPEMDGLELLGHLKKDESLSSIPVYVFSSSNNPQMRNRIMELGAGGFFYKPYDMPKLIKLFAGAPAVEPAKPMPAQAVNAI